ncbi:helix-turn-helix domain-containing protein [Geochorda subterranea]|uniref:helix-turn-helix domain-containing protein n=1 Tax=Geochorda subterranea TaxID=3109564 RepID=UPI0038601672
MEVRPEGRAPALAAGFHHLGLFHHRSSVARVAACVGVTERTVRKWRDRFLEAGVAGLYDRPRSGRPPRLARSSAAR